MEDRRDVSHIIWGIEMGLKYVGVVGQVPWLHQFLLGNITFREILAKLGFYDPVAIATNVSIGRLRFSPYLYPYRENE